MFLHRVLQNVKTASTSFLDGSSTVLDVRVRVVAVRVIGLREGRAEIVLKELVDKSENWPIPYISHKKGRGINYVLRVGLPVCKGKMPGVSRTAGSRGTAEEMRRVRHGLTSPDTVPIQGFGPISVPSFASAL